MSKFKIRESYLLLLIVLGLVSLGVYTTYALFTASTTINDVVGITATLDIGKSLTEYEVITVQPNETKLIELNVVNSYNDNIYYGAWYQLIQGDSNNIQIGTYTEKNPNSSSGVLSSNTSIKLLVGITNDNTTGIVLYLGVKGSLTNDLNLGDNKILLPNNFSEALLVTEEVLEEHKTIVEEPVNNSYQKTGSVQNVTLNPGTYKLEVWGAQGGSYSTTYAGGKGGYSYGTLTLTEETNLFVYVGGQGTSTDISTGYSNGGFNGGGKGTSSSSTYLSSSGGGASDIRIGQDSLYSRVIVAGGGGGFGSYNSNNRYSGGAGGGESGTAGGQFSTSYKGGLGGTQTSAGTSYFGTTANSTSSNTGILASFGVGASGDSSVGVSGGGGGFYGGGYGRRAAAGGGSGYVYTSTTSSNYPSGVLLTSKYYLTNAATIAGNQSFTDYDGTTVTGHSGDGYAKITGTAKIASYTIPNLTGLTDLRVQLGKNVDLISDTTLICENNTTTGCSITNVSITDTSILTEGTHIVTYTVKGKDNKKYLFNRNINVVDSPIATGSLGERILLDNPIVLTRTDFSTTNTENTTGTIFKQSSSSTSQMTEDVNNDGIGEDVYYYSGNHTKNWVKFGGFYWRIIRINEDASVRLLYSGTSHDTFNGRIGTSKYNSSSSDPRYVGYMYGTDSSLSNNRKNTKSSTVKSTIDNWYKTNLLTDYDKYVSKTAIYCNDRSVGDKTYSLFVDFYFGAWARNYTSKNPSYKCGGNGTGLLFETAQAIQDKFSVSTTNGGNGQLIYGVALITMDEVVFAGGVFAENCLTSPYPWYFSNSNNLAIVSGDTENTLTMSPSVGGNSAAVFYVNGEPCGDLTSGEVSYVISVRPVLSIKACAKYSSGDGSSSNPYTVTVDESCANAEN